MKIKMQVYNHLGQKSFVTVTGIINDRVFDYIPGDRNFSKNKIMVKNKELSTNSGFTRLYGIRNDLIEFGAFIVVEADEQEKRILLKLVLEDEKLNESVFI